MRWSDFHPQSQRSSSRPQSAKRFPFLLPTADSEVLFVSKSGHWKIADFGLTSKAFTSQAKTTQQSRGKPGHRAPELLQYPKSTYNKKVDIWSLGCILHELATGEKVFQTDTATFEFAISDQKVLVQLPLFDKPARSAISELLDETLRIDFRRRPTAEVVRRKVSELVSREMEPRETEISTASKTRKTLPVVGTAGIPTRRVTRALAWK
jgi:serine/threonine protein kinase